MIFDRKVTFNASLNGNALKYFAAKLVKSFGRLGVEAESLDDFRYRKACSFGIENRHPSSTERGVT